MPTPEPSAPPASPRPRGRPGYDREAVLRRAIDLFNVRGYEATSISDLASELGVSKSAIYYHFASKERILAAALDEALSGLDSVVAAAAQVGVEGTAYQRLQATVVTAVQILAAHRPAVTLLLRVRGNSTLEQEALERRRHIDVQLTTLVRRAMDEGALRSDIDSEVVSKLIFGMVNSLSDWYRPNGSLTSESLASTVASVLFHGLEARGD